PDGRCSTVPFSPWPPKLDYPRSGHSVLVGVSSSVHDKNVSINRFGCVSSGIRVDGLNERKPACLESYRSKHPGLKLSTIVQAGDDLRSILTRKCQRNSRRIAGQN